MNLVQFTSDGDIVISFNINGLLIIGKHLSDWWAWSYSLSQVFQNACLGELSFILPIAAQRCQILMK